MSTDKLTPSTTYAAIVGSIIVLLREEKKIDQATLAKSQNLSQSSWSRIERGESVINTEQLHSVALELGTTAGDILKRADELAAELKDRDFNILTAKSKKRNDGALAFFAGAALTALIVTLIVKK
ncbi:MAG: helix-turn-helix domain-containing protein [Rhodospirillales bacterium]